jgi:hypothetical protein
MGYGGLGQLGISFSILCGDPVQYKWRRHGFYHLRKSSQLEVEFSRAPEGHPGRTDQLLDLRDRTSVYAGCFLVSLFILVCSSPGVLP